MERVELNSIEEILADIKAGKAIVMMDDENRENEGDIIFAVFSDSIFICAAV